MYMKNELMVFSNKELKLKMRTIKNDDGSISVNAEDVAIGFGWTQTKNDKTYVKWERINGFLLDIGFSPDVGKDDFIPESLFYLLGMKASNDKAKDFQKWIAVDIIPQIRKTGSYIIPTKQADAIAVGKVMANADMEMLELVQSMVVNQIQLKKDLQLAEEQNKLLQIEVSHKEDVIIGLVEDIDLATKRQRLNQIMKYGFTTGKNQADKWSLLYNEFERKYHINLKIRMGRDNKDMKPKFKNKLDYIDRGMNMIPQTYELACKIFCNDVEKLKSEWFDTVGGK